MDVGETKPDTTTVVPRTGAIDFRALGLGALRILKDPAGSLEALYRPGKAALVQGLVIGAATAVLIPLVQAIVAKLAFGLAPGPGPVLRQMLGGIIFLAVAAAVSFVLRSAFIRSPNPDIKDDVYLAGSSMLFLLAGTVGGGIFFLFGDTFFAQVARTLTNCGWLLAGFTYYFGLRRMAKAETVPAVWTAVLVLGCATLMGALLHFATGPHDDPVALMQRAIKASAEDYMNGLRSLEMKPPGG